MASYMIHAYPKRMWYVEEYLVPSLLAQGIEETQIQIHNDAAREGNLKACMKAFAEVPDDDHGTWHLQDDVCICKDFKVRTEEYDYGLVCGFSSELYDGTGKVGTVATADMWFSFPCIRIPNQYAIKCSKWVLKYLIGNPVYKEFWEKGVNDDWAFRAWLGNYHKSDSAINLAPNLVDHVDYLLGGGSGKQRTQACRAQYWVDQDVITELEGKINGK